MLAPRGPNYLRLAERMCVLLVELESSDALGDSYAISNFVIGSAATKPITGDERNSLVDADIAPKYAVLHSIYRSYRVSVQVNINHKEAIDALAQNGVRAGQTVPIFRADFVMFRGRFGLVDIVGKFLFCDPPAPI